MSLFTLLRFRLICLRTSEDGGSYYHDNGITVGCPDENVVNYTHKEF